MLVYTDELPMVCAVAKVEKRDPDSARLLVQMALFDTLGDMIDEARADIDAIFSRSVAKRNGAARAVLVRTFVERRIEGEDVDDVVKAAGYLRDVTDSVVSKQPEGDGPETVDQWNSDHPKHLKDRRGRWARASSHSPAERTTYDVMGHLTHDKPGTKSRAEDVARELQGDRYSQMRVLGNALTLSNDPKVQTAGQVARLAAEIGPSAQDVLGPRLKRAAYRYRGTEKRPDTALRQWSSQASAASALYFGTNEERARVAASLEQVAPGDLAPAAVRANLRGPKAAKSEDQLRLRATTDVATGYLIDQLPTDKEAELSIEAGRTPPSVGVMVDRDGDVVSEAMGYNGDHYLPFDLKNLKRLHGGSYARTRALGGPTSEDLYTGLLSGARQMQVVSRSGVFRIEFDPDLRGGRRYSDKARQMVDRYQRLTDVVDRGTKAPRKEGEEPEGLFEQDLPPEVKRQLHRDAARAARYDEQDTKIIYERKLRRARAEASEGYSEEDLETEAESQANEWARNQTQAGRQISRGSVGRQREQILRELRDEAQSEGRVRRLQLNGEGYFRAMQSLKREFPYYIRDVDYIPLPEFEISRGVRGPDEPLSPRSGSPAKQTHVRRGNIVPAHQDREYGTRKPRADDDTTAGAEGGAGGPDKPDSGSGGRASKLAEATRTDAFVNRFADGLDGLRLLASDEFEPVSGGAGANLRGSVLQDEKLGTRDQARAWGSPTSYTAWLFNPRNEITHGRETEVARFLTGTGNVKAEPDEIKMVADSVQRIKDSAYVDSFNKDKLDTVQRMATLLHRVQDPFVRAPEVALHTPDREDPRPAYFSDIDALGDNSKKYEEWEQHAGRDEDLEIALRDTDGMSMTAIGAEVRTRVSDYNSSVEWGKQIAGRPQGEEVPKPPAGYSGGLDSDEAEALFRQGKSSRDYKELVALQRAYAYRYAKSMIDDLESTMGGGATPKAPGAQRLALTSGGDGRETFAHRAPVRKVLHHDQESPLAVALQKALSRHSRTGSRSRGPRRA